MRSACANARAGDGVSAGKHFASTTSGVATRQLAARCSRRKPGGVGEVEVVSDDQLTRGDADVELDRRRRGARSRRRKVSSIVSAVGLDLESHGTQVSAPATRLPWVTGPTERR